MPFYHRPPRDRRVDLAPATRPGAGARPDPAASTTATTPGGHPGTYRAPHQATPGPAGEVAEAGYAVVDLETTGLSPTTDAIVEIGLVLTAPDGTVTSSWSTLLDPGRDVGPTYVHGITQADVLGAPRLEDVADLLTASLAGRAVVAHNARFDVGFLVQALGASGHLDGGAPLPRVCTMEWSRHFLRTPSRRLTACCDVAGIELGHHHSALDDALASAALLRHYLGLCQAEPPWERVRVDAVGFTGWHWDARRAHAALDLLRPRAGVAAISGAALPVTAPRTPSDHPGPPRPGTGGVLERARFRQLARQAWADATVTDEEWGDLLSEARHLGLGDDEAAAIVRAARIVPLGR